MAPLQFGILMVPYQTLDVAGPLDVLSSCTNASMAFNVAAGSKLAASLIGKGFDIDYHHINETLSPVTLSSGFTVLPSTTCDTCPALDFLIIGGPDPRSFKLSERFSEFVVKHVEGGGTLFMTCSGAMAISSTGLLDGKRATTNHMCLPMARKMAPKVNWLDDQWVVDENIWSSGGACAGMDMMAQWVVENYGMELVRCGLEVLDFEPRDLEGKKLFMG